MKKRNITLFTAFAAAAAFASTAQAGTIYSDDFSGSAGDLSGTGPAPGWTAATGAGAWQLDGSGKAETGVGASQKFAWLPFTPTAGNEYTLSADVDVTSGGWISIDFARDNSPGVAPVDGTPLWTVDTYAWMLRKSAGTIQTFNGLGVTNGSHGSSAAGSELKVVLNTVPTQWTVEYFVGGTSLGTPKAYTTNPTDIRWVGFGTESGAGTVDNFLLTDIAGTTPAADPEITAIDYDPDADTVTLTWRSRPGTTYKAFASLDLIDWSEELADSLGPETDGIIVDGKLLTMTFPLENGLENDPDVFFRIQEE